MNVLGDLEVWKSFQGDREAIGRRSPTRRGVAITIIASFVVATFFVVLDGAGPGELLLVVAAAALFTGISAARRGRRA